MPSPPTVSVVIAAYNAEDTIEQAITAALAQTGVELEVIVIDDKSVDGTSAAVEKLADPRLSFIRLETNGGPSAARNAGLKRASGDWYAVLDADDTMKPDRLQTLIQAAEERQADIIADNMIVDRGGGDTSLFIQEPLDLGTEVISLTDFALQNRLFERGLGYGYLKPIIRRSFLTRHGLTYEERLRIGEDFHLVAEMLALNAVYVRQRSAAYIYRVGSGSISHRLSTANATAMVEADRRFIASYDKSLSIGSRSAIERHLRSLEHGAAFSKMVDALKEGSVSRFAMQAFKSPLALRHFAMPVSARIMALKDKIVRR